MRTLISLAAVLVISVPVVAEDELRPVASLVNEGTLTVTHVRMDEKLIQTLFDKAKAFQKAMDKAHPTKQPASAPSWIIADWCDRFDLAGGKEIYFVTTPTIGQVTAIPLNAKLDIPKMLKVFNAQDASKSVPEAKDSGQRAMQQFQTVGKRVGNLLVIGPRQAVSAMDNFTPAAREDLSKAFTAMGDAPVKIVICPPQIMMKLMPASLPANLGGYSSEPFTTGLRWIAISVKADSALSVDLVVQAADAKSAQAMLDTYNKAMQFYKDSVANADPSSPEAIGGTLVTAFTDLLPPKVKGDQIVATADPEKVKKMEPNIINGIVAARLAALRTEATWRVRNLCTAIIAYANSHKGEFPPDLQTLVKSRAITERALANPHLPDRTPGYVYVKPSAPRDKVPADTVVLYENYQTWDDEGIVVGFADGHTQTVKAESQFKAMLSGPQSRPQK